MAKIIINNMAALKATGIHTRTNNRPVINYTNGDVYASVTDAAEVLKTCVSNVIASCKAPGIRSCKGNHLDYVDHASGNVDLLAERLQMMYAKQSELERKANLLDDSAEFDAFRAYKAKKAEVAKLKATADELLKASQDATEAYWTAKRELDDMKEAL